MNKVASDLESAIARVMHYAAPANNIRYGLKNPCVETGLCSDCRTPQRICNMWSTIEGHMIEGRIHVKLVGSSLAIRKGQSSDDSKQMSEVSNAAGRPWAISLTKKEFFAM
jgi:hypothetical protein